MDNCIDLVLVICDDTHNTKERKQGKIALIECAVELFTTMQKLSDSIDDYYKIFIVQNDTA